METVRTGRVLPDLVGLLPKGVWPTPLRVLECNKRFLFIREYAASDTLSPVHERMWKRLAGTGDCTVLCVWGGLNGTVREAIQLFDHRGMGPRTSADAARFRQEIRSWWREAETWPA